MQWYKRVIIFFSLALLVMPVLSSCDRDGMDDNIVPGQQKAGNRYVYFRIENTDNVTSRADSGDLEKDEDENHDSGDLVNGQDREHAIGATGNFCLFFNAAGNLTEILALELATVDNPVGDPVDDEQHIREAVYGTKLTVEEDEVFPKSCLLILNGQPLYTKLSQSIGKSVNEVLELVWEDENPWNIGKNDSGLFTMTSSIYLDGTTKKSTVDITTDNLQEEGTFDSKKVVIVHVERMLAKFSLRFQNASSTVFRPSENADLIVFGGFDSADAPQYIAKKWRIEVTGWNVNAFESQVRVFKDINASTNYFNGWNDPFNHRSFWGEDVHYTDTDYPWQYRWAMDSNCLNYSEKITAAGNGNMLTNMSFSALQLDGPKSGEAVGDLSKLLIYAPGNTYDARSVAGRLDDRDTLLACEHLLIGAQLQLEKAGAPNTFEAVDLYRDRSGLYYTSKQDCFAALMHAFAQSLSSQRVMEYTVYNWDEGGEINEDVVAKTEGGYQLYYKNQELNDTFLREVMEMSSEEFDARIGVFNPAPLRSGDGKQVPWIATAIEDGDLTIQKMVDGKFEPLQICERVKDHMDFVTAGTVVRDADKNDIKSLLYEWVGAVDHFNMGRMYYAHGIDNPTATEAKPRRYGVIRNNWYTFNLKNINRIGIPVDDPDQPILPETVGFNDMINLSVYIIPWHEVSTTTPVLPN